MNTSAFVKSLRFWGSLSAEFRTCKAPVFPATAYNFLIADPVNEIPAGRLGPHEPGRDILLAITAQVLARWQRPFDSFHLQQLRWALSNVHNADQETILNYLNNERNYPMKPAQTNLSPDVVAKLTMSLASLEQALLAKDPMMPKHLKESHQLLISYPETVHLLDDDEIARLISAAQIHTGVEIVKAAAAKGGSRKKISADDL